MPTTMLLDYMGTLLDAEKAQGKTIGLNIILRRDKQEECSLLLRNSIINNRAEGLHKADATLALYAASLAALITGMVSYSEVCVVANTNTAQHPSPCAVVQGDTAKAAELFSVLTPAFPRNFPLVAPDTQDQSGSSHSSGKLTKKRLGHVMRDVFSIDQAACADQGTFPVRYFKALRTYALPRAGAVDKLAIARINARMQAARTLPIFENENIRRLQPLPLCDKPARPRLIRGNAGKGNTLLPIGPLNKTGTVKAFAGSIPAGPVTGTYLRIRGFHNFFRRQRRFRRHSGRGAMGAATAKPRQHKQAQERAARPQPLAQARGCQASQ